MERVAARPDYRAVAADLSQRDREQAGRDDLGRRHRHRHRPSSEGGWVATDAYTRVYQDWRTWTEEGSLTSSSRSSSAPSTFPPTRGLRGLELLDAQPPVSAQGRHRHRLLPEFDRGTIKQIHLVYSPANPLEGVVLYSIGAHNAPVTRNPLAVPAGRDTPLRTFDDLSSGLRTGRTVAGQALEAGGSANGNVSPLGVFASQTLQHSSQRRASRSGTSWALSWGTWHATRHAEVVFDNDAGQSKSVMTDGGRFLGRRRSATGPWRVSVYPAGAGSGRYIANCTLTIVPGQVVRFDLQVTTSNNGVASCLSSSSSRSSGPSSLR